MKNPNAAKVLLRTLFEAHIDIIYHQIKDSEQRLSFSAKRMFDERIKMLNAISSLIKKYPNLESRDETNLFNSKYLAKALADQDKHKQAILRPTQISRELSICKTKLNYAKKAKLRIRSQVASNACTVLSTDNYLLWYI